MPDLTVLEFKDDLDPLGRAFKTVRDATVCNEGITLSEKIAVLEVVKHELTLNFYNTMLKTGLDHE